MSKWTTRRVFGCVTSNILALPRARARAAGLEFSRAPRRDGGREILPRGEHRREHAVGMSPHSTTFPPAVSSEDRAARFAEHPIRGRAERAERAERATTDATLTDDPAPIASRVPLAAPALRRPDRRARPPRVCSPQLRASDAAVAETGAETSAATDVRARRGKRRRRGRLVMRRPARVRRRVRDAFGDLHRVRLRVVRRGGGHAQALPASTTPGPSRSPSCSCSFRGPFAGRGACRVARVRAARPRRALCVGTSRRLSDGDIAAIAKIAYKYLNYATGTVLRASWCS